MHQPTLDELVKLSENVDARLIALVLSDRPQEDISGELDALYAQQRTLSADIQRLRLNPSAVLVGRY